MQNLSTFVRKVSDTVEHVIIADDVLAGSIEGIEVALLFLRFRVLELDAMKAAQKPISELFNAVMQTDYELRSLASFPGEDWWVIQPSTNFSVDVVLQYWHKYFTVRTHLQLALMYDGQNEQFFFNFITCLHACKDLAARYLSLRPAAPTGFFANWVIDMQAFTGVVFLQLASYRITHNSVAGRSAPGFDVNSVADLIEQVAKTMESSTGRAGGDFARQAASVVRSLDSLLRRPHISGSQGTSVKLPLIGTIQISRKPYSKTNIGPESRSTPAVTQTQPQSSETERSSSTANPVIDPQPGSYTSDTMDFMDSFSYSMEFPESYPFLGDEDLSGWM
ncbi:hypothetical protein N0V94_008449 [Neodidymelliopsis sp. IMI 364377]|nr:hypothetical protein N0V94_008449 [Neodidymelliopsis sp. IMI 364377]